MPDNSPLLIGLDLGTTTCKAIAVTPEGRVLASAPQTYRLRSPHSGWAEEDVEEVWQGVVHSLKRLASQISPGRFVGLCLSGAMHSLLPVAADGSPLAPAMTWADQRATPQLRLMRARTDPQVLYRRTGCPLQTIYHPPKLRWWVEQSSEATMFVAIKDFVLHRLTGEWATDWSLASTTGLFDIHRLAWDENALALAGVAASQLPPLVSPQTLVGGLTRAIAAETGLPNGLPVIAGGSDGAMANLGSGVVVPGQVTITVGTSGAVRKMVSRPQFDPAERTWCYLLIEDRWFAGGAINNGGLALQWVREKLYPDLPGEAGYTQLLNEAEAVGPGAEGVFVLPYFTGERSPYWNPEARAMIYGLGLEHSRGHLARATLEGVAFCLADVWEALRNKDEAEPALLSGGITRSKLWTQIVADVLGLRLAPIEMGDASALGAALLGYWALGALPTLDDLPKPAQTDRIVEPDPERHVFYANAHRKFQELYRRNW
jgi:gluconokinase